MRKGITKDQLLSVRETERERGGGYEKKGKGKVMVYASLKHI